MWSSSETRDLFVEKPSGLCAQTQSVSAGQAFSQPQQLDTPDQAIRWTEREDRVLIARGLSGDRHALDELFARYARVGYRNALAILGNTEDAEDALQDGLFSAFRNLRRFEGRAGFSTWLTRIVINAALMRLRSRRVYQTVPLAEGTGEHGKSLIDVLHDAHPTPEEEVSDHELRKMAAGVVCQLPCQQKRVLLNYLRGCSLRNIAEILGISIGCVKSTLHRSRLKVTVQIRALTLEPELRRHARADRQALITMKSRQRDAIVRQVGIGRHGSSGA